MTLPASARELSPEEWELVARATETIDAATDAAPREDGVHTVGAAVRSGDGRIFTGVNLSHFTGGPCAELVALGAARAGGAKHVVAIVAVGNHGRGPLAPCGRDRQVLVDYYPGVRVVLPTPLGVRSVVIEDLLPLAYARDRSRSEAQWEVSHDLHRVPGTEGDGGGLGTDPPPLLG